MGFFSRIKKIFGAPQDESLKQDESPKKEPSAREEPANDVSAGEHTAEQSVGSAAEGPAPASTATPAESVTEAPVIESAETAGEVAEARGAGEESPGRALTGAADEAVGTGEAVEIVESVEFVEAHEVVEVTAPAAADMPHVEPEGEVGAETGGPEQSVVGFEAATGARSASEQAQEKWLGSESRPDLEEQPDPLTGQEASSAPAAGEEPVIEEPVIKEPVIIDLLEVVSDGEEAGEEGDGHSGANTLSGTPESPVEAPAAARGDSGRLTGPVYQELTRRLREAEARLPVWLDIVLDGVTEAGEQLNDRVLFLLRTLEAPENEAQAFVDDFAGWLERMDYRQLDEFRSELQYRLALALDLEDEEDERSRLLVKLTDSLSRTREQFVRRFEGLISSHGELDDAFWEELEEIFIMADLGVEASMELVERLKERARVEKATTSEQARELLRQEIRSIFTRPRHIVGIEPPEVVLMIGVNGAGKTTTIAKLAYRDRMQGKKVMIAAADTFRAAAIEQLEVWAGRVGCLFHAKQAGSDPASVAYEATDRAMKEGVDVLYIDTAGRLQTKVNLMDELAKIRNVIAKKHPGAPHRTVLVLDATTGQNALSQARLFKESAGVDELVLTKLDGTAKGGVAIAVAMQHKLPIAFVGIGEKMEDLRPFSGDDYADALLNI